jgi:hypothetical protein
MFVNKHCRDHLDSLIYFVSICKPEAIQACLTSSESPHYRTEVPGHPTTGAADGWLCHGKEPRIVNHSS